MSEYHTLYGPGFNPSTGIYGDDVGEFVAPVVEELLYSTQGGYTQKGCTLAAGQGVVRSGSIIASRADGLYVKAGAAGAGAAEGVLHFTVDTGTDTGGPTYQGNIVIQGILKNSVVQAAQTTDGADLGARINANMDTFTF
jgi:hypothetical protein